MEKALYRKYRPTKLEDIVGQESTVSALSTAIKKGNISHAYLFTGPRGTGKTSIARIFAHAVNNFDYQLEDDYIDIIEIDAASNTGVDNIRELREKAVIAPTKGKYKVYIIDEVHMLSKSAFNALLKILEEPPAHVIFIMATTDPQKVPITITSRAQNYTFHLAPPDIMKKHLSAIAKAEKIKIKDDALDIIVRRGGGSFRDSISLLDQISSLPDAPITQEVVEKALGLPQDEIIKNLLSAYAEQDVDKITTLLKEAINTGAKPETLAEETINQIIIAPKRELLPLLNKLPEVKAPFPEAKLLTAFLLTDGAPARPATPVAVLPAEKKTPVPAAPSGPAQRANQETKPPAASPADFSWDNFLESVQSRSTLLFNFLKNAHYQQDGNILNVYIKNQSIINSPNNKALLTQLAGLDIVTHDSSEYNKTNNSNQFSQISDIMGNVEEVKNDGRNPFE